MAFTSGHGEAAASSARERLTHQVRELCRRTGRSYRQLEPDLHISDSSLSRYVTGRSIPPWEIMARLCALTGTAPGSVRVLWEQAQTEAMPDAPDPATPATELTASSTVPAEERATGSPRRWLAGGVLVIAMAASAAAGTWFGATELAAPPTTAPPTEQDACASWPWPPQAGQEVEQPASPVSVDHAPVAHLMTGQEGGRQLVWASLTAAAYGDRVWLDTSTDGGATWTQCGPFPVTSDRGVTRANPVARNTLHRACADTPRARPGYPRNACTDFW